MLELLIVSGKGGAGKTTVSGVLDVLGEDKALADSDVDAANLHLLFRPDHEERLPYEGSTFAHID